MSKSGRQVVRVGVIGWKGTFQGRSSRVTGAVLGVETPAKRRDRVTKETLPLFRRVAYPVDTSSLPFPCPRDSCPGPSAAAHFRPRTLVVTIIFMTIRSHLRRRKLKILYGLSSKSVLIFIKPLLLGPHLNSKVLAALSVLDLRLLIVVVTDTTPHSHRHHRRWSVAQEDYTVPGREGSK